MRYQVKPEYTFYSVDSAEAFWNTGREEAGGTLGYKLGVKGGYFPVSPNDHFVDLRDQMVTNLQAVGLDIERAHHEVGSAGQHENEREQPVRPDPTARVGGPGAGLRLGHRLPSAGDADFCVG